MTMTWNDLQGRAIPEPNTGCLLWLGWSNGKGYGQLFVEDDHWMAHRLAFHLVHGPIPAGLCILHRCDTPSCINPDHLFLGTIAENNRDMTVKGRHAGRRVTHCPRGHEYTDENTYRCVRKKGWTERGCRACRAASHRRLLEAAS